MAFPSLPHLFSRFSSFRTIHHRRFIPAFHYHKHHDILPYLLKTSNEPYKKYFDTRGVHYNNMSGHVID